MAVSSNHQYSIGQLANEFAITTRSIRFYEEQGLLKPQRNGNTRVYQHKDKVQLTLILRGKRLNFSLAEIKEILSLYQNENNSYSQLEFLLALIPNKRALLLQQRQDIEVLLTELTQLEQHCQNSLQLQVPSAQVQKQVKG